MTTLAEQVRALDRSFLDTHDEAAIAAELNKPRPVVGAVSRQLFAMWAGQSGMRAAIEDAANTPNDPLRSIALTCRDFIQGAADNINLSMPQNQAMLQAWVSFNRLSQENHDALITLATQQVSSNVTPHDVRLVCRDYDGNWVV
jgi:hypothetical protein